MNPSSKSTIEELAGATRVGVADEAFRRAIGAVGSADAGFKSVLANATLPGSAMLGLDSALESAKLAGSITGIQSVLESAKLAGTAAGLKSVLGDAKMAGASTSGLDIVREQMRSATDLVGHTFRERFSTIGDVAREHLSAIKAANVAHPAVTGPEPDRTLPAIPPPREIVTSDAGRHLRAMAERGREAMDLQRRQVEASEETLRIAREERDAARAERDEARKESRHNRSLARAGLWVGVAGLVIAALTLHWDRLPIFGG